MGFRALGRTGIRLFPVGLGAMPLSLEGGPGEETGISVILASLERGVNCIDTANVYCPNDNDIGHNERLIRKALGRFGGREPVVVATKGGLDRRGPAWPSDARPEFLRSSCEGSLRALGVPAITLYQLHAPDRKVPFEDSVGELARLKEEGKILHVGLSNVTVAQLEAALAIVRIESVQNRCNPFECEDYRGGMLRACEEQGITYLPYAVVGGQWGHARAQRHPALQELAAKYGRTSYEVIVAWHLAVSDRVVPIPGASKIASAVSSAAAAELRLSPEDVRRIAGIC
ncbi:MAG: aldo/keto reductase [Elusimicrobia bacterium]|nr:aldo/keto reductase [Elusimicrobiota bacterium]